MKLNWEWELDRRKGALAMRATRQTVELVGDMGLLRVGRRDAPSPRQK